jgi:hypothetical protein
MNGTTGGAPAPPEQPNWERPRATLPDWMRDPPPPRMTLGRRVSMALDRRPAWRALRRRWWAWQERRRLYQRFPVGFKIVAFFASWLLALALVLGVYAVFSLI